METTAVPGHRALRIVACALLLPACAPTGGGAVAPPPPAYGEHRAAVAGRPYLAWSAPTGEGTLVIAFPADERDAVEAHLRTLVDDPAAAIAAVCRGAERIEGGIFYHPALGRVLGVPTLAGLVRHRPLRRGELRVEAQGYRDFDGRQHMMTGVRQGPDGAIEALFTARTGFLPTVMSGPEVRLGSPAPGEAEALLAAWDRAREEVSRVFPYGGGKLPRTHVPACH